MAVETNADAYLPVAIVLIKLHLQTFFESLFSFSSYEKSSSSSSQQQTTRKKETINIPQDDIEPSWDLYLMAALIGLIGALYLIRRQRIAALRQLPVQ